jgi:hypothetical protein
MNHDIQTFVIEQLDHNLRFSRISGEGKAFVKESLVGRAGGMCVSLFVYVQII